MEKAINLFIVGTSYQYLSAVNLCLEKFNGNKFENHLFYFKNPKLEITCPEALGEKNVSIKPIEIKDKVEFYKSISKYHCIRFFFFQEGEIMNKFAAFHLKKNGAIICLGPDGTKPYAIFNKRLEFFSIIRNTFNDYKILFQNKMFFNAFMPSNYKYGSSYIIDEIYVQYKDMFDPIMNNSKGKVIELPALTDLNVKRIAQTMGFNNIRTKALSGNIVYFNQPIKSDLLINQEINILKEILKKNPGKKLFVKLHPSTPEKTRFLYVHIDNLTIIDDKQPSEFYLTYTSNSVIISGWSAASMHNLGINNKYYYLYPIFKQLGDRALDQIGIVPFSHIEVISNFGQLAFPG